MHRLARRGGLHRSRSQNHSLKKTMGCNEVAEARNHPLNALGTAHRNQFRHFSSQVTAHSSQEAVKGSGSVFL
jgi:hypothetical protein